MSNEKEITEDIAIEILKKKLLELHPDRTGGHFSSDEDEQSYHSINKAINKLNTQREKVNEYLPMELAEMLLPALIKKNNDEVVDKKRQKVEAAERKLIDARRNTIQKVKVKYTLPKFSSTSIFGVLTILFFLPKSIKENEEIMNLVPFTISNPFLWWSVALFVTICMWLYMLTEEKKIQGFITHLNDESFISRYFDDFIMSRSSFSARDFAMYLRREADEVDKYIRRKSSSIFRYRNTMLKLMPPLIVAYVFILEYIGISIVNDSINFFMLLLFVLLYIYVLERYMRISLRMLDYEILFELSNYSMTKAEQKGIIELVDVKSLADYYKVVE